MNNSINSINMNNNLLEIKNLNMRFGGIVAVSGVSFSVEKGKIITLIGANGAGKSTTLRCIAGIYHPQEGEILMNGKNIVGQSPDKIVKQGITLVPEGRHVFPNLTVAENLKIGAYLQKKIPEEEFRYVYELFPRLKEREWQLAGTLSGGEQQMLAVGRAMMAKPRVMMMDEPSLGLAPLVVRNIFSIITELKKRGMTILLIEQNANAALKCADYGFVLETGRITMQGTGAQLLSDPRVKEAYLGSA